MTASEFSETYDALASRFDEWSSRVEPDVRAEGGSKVDGYIPAGERVVELGYGTGVPVGRLLADRYVCTGVDTSNGMLAKAHETLPGDAVLLHADMHTVRFASGSLGGVVAFYSISHTPREQHASLFGRIASWLRPGGVFVGNLHYFDDPDDFEGNWLGVGPMRWSGFDGATNRRLLVEAGFVIVEYEPITQTEPDGSKICPMWFVALRRTPRAISAVLGWATFCRGEAAGRRRPRTGPTTKPGKWSITFVNPCDLGLWIARDHSAERCGGVLDPVRGAELSHPAPP